MPATIVGLVIVALVALPGLAYQLARSRHRPGESFAGYSPRIVASGLVFSLISLTVVALIGEYWTNAPLTGPADLARGTSDYLTNHARRLIWTALLVLASSVLLAWLAGRRAGTQDGHLQGIRYHPEIDPWWIVLMEEPQNEGRAYAYVDLRDGTSVGGLVAWFTAQSSSGNDRDLVLLPWADGVDAHWRQGPAAKAKLRRLFLHPDPQNVDVSLRTLIPGDQIARLHVRYLADTAATALIDALRRWGTANAPDRLRVSDTMTFTLVTVDKDQPMTIYRKSGKVHLDLGLDGIDAPHAFLARCAADKLRRRGHTYELAASALVDSQGLNPALIEHVLQPLLARAANTNTPRTSP